MMIYIIIWSMNLKLNPFKNNDFMLNKIANLANLLFLIFSNYFLEKIAKLF